MITSLIVGWYALACCAISRACVSSRKASLSLVATWLRPASIIARLDERLRLRVDVADLAREPQRVRRPGAVLRPVGVDAAVRDGEQQLGPGRLRDGLGHEGERPVQVGL